jgi:hypothetical protein
VRLEIADTPRWAEARCEALALRLDGGGSQGLLAQPNDIGIQSTLALPFFGLWPRMPPPFKRDIQREGTRRMERKRIAVAV